MEQIQPQTKFCTECGKELNAKAELCIHCGVRQSVMTAAGGKSKMTAGIFGILLGGIGVHKFYMGKPLLGVVYILFCWTGIPALIGLVEGILYLTMSDEKFAAKLA
jgi:TM2 domain-containing membrane protein YozV